MAGAGHPAGRADLTQARRTSRTGRPDGKTSPEELAAAAHCACFAMALALRLDEHTAVPERLSITATVTLDEVGGPTIVSSALRVNARVPDLAADGLQAVVVEEEEEEEEAAELCPVSRLFAGAKITAEAVLEPGP
ncbi:MAG TPA: OsmC family peroxiredoxin [Streptosporangiaceae bacterium]|nr:OsmC family peroxiredoxin [Streptosporangiaceae bacterium]